MLIVAQMFKNWNFITMFSRILNLTLHELGRQSQQTRKISYLR